MAVTKDDNDSSLESDSVTGTGGGGLEDAAAADAPAPGPHPSESAPASKGARPTARPSKRKVRKARTTYSERAAADGARSQAPGAGSAQDADADAPKAGSPSVGQEAPKRETSLEKARSKPRPSVKSSGGKVARPSAKTAKKAEKPEDEPEGKAGEKSEGKAAKAKTKDKAAKSKTKDKAASAQAKEKARDKAAKGKGEPRQIPSTILEDDRRRAEARARLAARAEARALREAQQKQEEEERKAASVASAQPPVRTRDKTAGEQDGSADDAAVAGSGPEPSESGSLPASGEQSSEPSGSAVGAAGGEAAAAPAEGGQDASGDAPDDTQVLAPVEAAPAEQSAREDTGAKHAALGAARHAGKGASASKKGGPGLTRGKVAAIVAAAVVAVLIAVAGSVSWNLWYRYDDAADIQGEWQIANADRTLVITNAVLKIDEDVNYSYTLDTKNKTITFRFGDASGTASYRFSEDRLTLIIDEEDTDTDWLMLLGLKQDEAMESDDLPDGVTKLTKLSSDSSGEPQNTGEDDGDSSDSGTVVVEGYTDYDTPEISSDDEDSD